MFELGLGVELGVEIVVVALEPLVAPVVAL